MSPESEPMSRIFAGKKLWAVLIMIGYAIAAVGFLLLPVAIGWFPIAPILIVGGFGLSLAAWLTRRFRVIMLKKIRKDERQGHIDH